MKKPEWLPVVGQGRAVLAALTFADPPRLRLFLKAADEQLGQRARELFARRAADERTLHGGAGEFAFFDTPIDPATAFATLQRLIGEPTKK
jgi:hypothetical protein